MAGIYNDAPSRRMAYDIDGSVGLYYDTGAATALGGLAEFNDEDNVKAFGLGSNQFRWLAFVFPELRELDGIFTAVVNSTFDASFGAVASSANTTNGIDGTWTTQIANITDHLSCYDKFRDNITSMAVAAQSGIRARYGQSADTDSGAIAIHLYGPISPGETPDRILFLDTESGDAVFTKPLDYAEVPRGQTQVRTIRLKNNSSTFSINTVQITAEDLYLNAGDWYTFGDDGIAYQATFAVGNMGTGATKLIYVKQAVPDGETLGLHTGRIKVSHADLT